MRNIITIISILSTIYCFTQTVNIPDVNFKTALLNHEPVIDINDDNEIQISEAYEYSGVLFLNDKNITSLAGIESFINVTQLYCNSNQIEELDLSLNTQLTRLSCGGNNLVSLDLENNTLLTNLQCAVNQLQELSISNCVLLENLDFYLNQITNIDLSGNTLLFTLICRDNLLNTLDLSNNPNLQFLNCSENELISVDFSNSISLEEIHCELNNFMSLDLSNTTALKRLICGNNSELEFINLKNGNNVSLQLGSCYFQNNPNLETVCIDDLNNSNLIDFILNEVNHTVDFTEDCNLGINEFDLKKNISLYPNPSKDIININSIVKVKEIQIYNIYGKLIKSKISNSNAVQINISSLAPGIYFIITNDTDKNSFIKKVIKN